MENNEKEYAIVIARVDGNFVYQLRKGDKIIESMTWNEALDIKNPGAYLLNKHNIPFEAAGYSCN